MKQKIMALVSHGYKEAAFTRPEHAQMFADLWRKRGHHISTMRSWGPTVEGDKHIRAYRVVAYRKPLIGN